MNDVSPVVLETIEDSKKSKTKEDKPVEVRLVSFDGVMKAADVQLVTGLSRVTIWRLEKQALFPARVQLSLSRVGWHGNEIKEWINTRPRVDLDSCEVESVAESV